MTRLLLVEDEEHLAINLEFNLQEEGYEVDVASTLSEARALLPRRPDLLVLDLMLPDGFGTDFCQELRRAGDLTPVLILTAKGAPDDIVSGLESGADDYMTKPFALRELLGRVRAILRRRQWERPQPALTRFTFGAHAVHFDSGEVFVKGQAVALTALELRLLRCFVEHKEQILSREALLEAVWGLSPETNTRTVDNFLVRLRRVFEEDPSNPRHFVTARGLGYRFVP